MGLSTRFYWPCWPTKLTQEATRFSVSAHPHNKSEACRFGYPRDVSQVTRATRVFFFFFLESLNCREGGVAIKARAWSHEDTLPKEAEENGGGDRVKT